MDQNRNINLYIKFKKKIFNILKCKFQGGVSQAKLYIETAREGIEVANQALDLYSKVLDRIVPWEQFEKTLNELEHYRKDFTQESADLLGEIKTHLMHGMDAYFRSTQSVFEWAGFAANLLETYIKLFAQNDASKSESQKKLLVKVLVNGIERMTLAQGELDNSSASFNVAAGKLTSLNHRLETEFDSKSGFYQDTLSVLRHGGVIFEIIGHISPIGKVGDLVVNKVLVPELDKKFQSIKFFYDETKSRVAKAYDDITETKEKLRDEIRVIGEFKIRTDETYTYVDMDQDLKDMAIDVASKLIVQCREYRERHSTPK